MIEPRKYLDLNWCPIEVRAGLGEGVWIVVRGNHRVRGKGLEPRPTREELQTALDDYAASHGWSEYSL